MPELRGECIGDRPGPAGVIAAGGGGGHCQDRGPGAGRGSGGAPAKPQNVLTPDLAFTQLMRGNKRYVDGVTRRHDFRTEREALAQGQNPFAGILSCADSRIAPEYAFDSFRGDLFVVRVAGNFLNEDNLANFEYAEAEMQAMRDIKLESYNTSRQHEVGDAQQPRK